MELLSLEGDVVHTCIHAGSMSICADRVARGVRIVLSPWSGDPEGSVRQLKLCKVEVIGTFGE